MPCGAPGCNGQNHSACSCEPAFGAVPRVHAAQECWKWACAQHKDTFMACCMCKLRFCPACARQFQQLACNRCRNDKVCMAYVHICACMLHGRVKQNKNYFEKHRVQNLALRVWCATKRMQTRSE